MTKRILWGDLIKIAREDIAKSGGISSGKLKGAGAPIAIVLFADKFNKTYKTTDDTIFQFIEKNQTEYGTRTTDVNFLFKNYYSLLEHQKKPEYKDPNNKLSDKEYQSWWVARNSGLHSWIYIRVLHLLYEMDYEIHSKGGSNTAKIYKPIKDWALKRAHEIRAKNKTISKHAIAQKITLKEYKSEDWEHPLTEFAEKDTIYRWLRADKSF